MRRRKHRLVLDVTFSHPMTQRSAAKAARLLLGRLDLDAAPIWVGLSQVYADKLVVKEPR